MTKLMLWCGVAVPFLYFGSQITAIALNPGYDIAAQQPSELGCCGARAPIVANAGFIATGVAALVGGIGLFLTLKRVLAALAALCLIAFGVAMTMSGLFPLPDPRHYGFGLLPLGVVAPLFGAFALKDAGARWTLLAAFAASAVLVALSAGVGGVADATNVGLFSRALALIAFPAIGFLCWRAKRP